MEAYETEKQPECDDDHFDSNQCRIESQFHRVQDICIAPGEDNIKREIVKNGPVLA